MGLVSNYKSILTSQIVKQLLFVVFGFNLMFANTIIAQSSSELYKHGTVIIAAGYGYPNVIHLLNKYNKTHLNYSANTLGPIHFKISLAINNNVDVLINVNTSLYNATWQKQYNNSVYNYNLSVSSAATLLRLNIHLNKKNNIDNLDYYIGLGVGRNYYRIVSENNNPNDEFEIKNLSDNFWAMEATVGVRYFISKNIGIYGEFGYAKSIAQGGLIIKFNKK